MVSNRLEGPEGLVLGHRSIVDIGRAGQSVSARNYEVWLAYHTDPPPALRKAMDAMIASGDVFDEAAMDGLYQEHFARGTKSHDVIDTGARIASEVADALDALKLGAQQTGRYGEALDAAVLSLGFTSDVAQLGRIVSQLAFATGQMAIQQQAIEEKLSESSAEMEQLQAALEAARKQSLTDALTGLANRKRFEETLQLRLAEAADAKAPLVVAMCDIDHFKRINDAWGHPTGDTVIKLIGGMMSRFALGDQLVGRLGGEEFGIIMPRIPMAHAAEHIDNLRKSIHANRLRRKGSEEVIGQVSVSFGLASLRPGESAAQLLARADACLYASKRGGRNRVTTDEAHEALEGATPAGTSIDGKD